MRTYVCAVRYEQKSTEPDILWLTVAKTNALGRWERGKHILIFPEHFSTFLLFAVHRYFGKNVIFLYLRELR